MRCIFRWAMHLTLSGMLLFGIVLTVLWPFSWSRTFALGFLGPPEVGELGVALDSGMFFVVCQTTPLSWSFYSLPEWEYVWLSDPSDPRPPLREQFRLTLGGMAIISNNPQDHWLWITIPMELGMLICISAPAIWFTWVYRARHRRDPTACPACHYDLRATTIGATCPECGAPVTDTRPSPSSTPPNADDAGGSGQQQADR